MFKGKLRQRLGNVFGNIAKGSNVIEKIFTFLKQPEVQAFIRFLLAAFLGGFAANEIREPQYTAKWLPSFFGQRVERPDPLNAIGRITFGRSGCTATIIGPVDSRAAKLSILTAAHCVDLNARGTMKLKDGRSFSVRCVSRDAKADVAWLEADRPEGKIPYARLAASPPPQGSPVWHIGYGIDKPGNRENGTYLGLAANGVQCRFRLSVSPGDSGGAIVFDSSGEVVSPVCCTTRLAGVGDVFGSAPASNVRTRPVDEVIPTNDEPELGAEPIHPIQPLPHPDWPAPPV